MVVCCVIMSESQLTNSQVSFDFSESLRNIDLYRQESQSDNNPAVPQESEDIIIEEEVEEVEENDFEGVVSFQLDSTDNNNFVYSDWQTSLDSLIEKDYSNSSEQDKDSFFVLFFNLISQIPTGISLGKFGLGNIRNVLLGIIYKIKSMPVVSTTGLYSSYLWMTSSDVDHKSIIFKSKNYKFDKWGLLKSKGIKFTYLKIIQVRFHPNSDRFKNIALSFSSAVKSIFSSFTQSNQISVLNNSNSSSSGGVSGGDKGAPPDLVICNRICSVGHLMVDPTASKLFDLIDNGPPKGINFYC